MPELNPDIANVGTGFASFLSPPPPEVIRFSVGQPDFDTPQPVIDAAKAALDRGETTYTRPQGSPEVCEAVSEHLSRRHGVDCIADDVVVTPGCKQAILYALMATCSRGDEVLLLAPAWPSYDGMIRLLGLVPIHVPVKRSNYHPDFDALKSAITSKTKAILLNSPNNPTGAVYTPNEIQELVSLASEHDLWIYDDMIYSDLVWSEHGYTSPTQFDGGAERTITIGGWSKAWAMTGWRLGWITGSPDVMRAIRVCNASAATHVPTFNMPAAATALALEEEAAAMRYEFARRREIIHERFSAIPGLEAPKPEGAFYILVDVSGTGMSDVEFATRALSEAQVQLIPASLMEGGEGLVRISYATSIENINEGCDRIERWLSSL